MNDTEQKLDTTKQKIDLGIECEITRLKDVEETLEGTVKDLEQTLTNARARRRELEGLRRESEQPGAPPSLPSPEDPRAGGYEIAAHREVDHS